VTFASGANGTLKFDDSLVKNFFTGTISGLTTKTPIDLADLPYSSGFMSAKFTSNAAGAGGTLTVTNAKLNDIVTLNLTGNYSGASWFLSQDSSKTGTLVVDPPVDGSLNPGPNGGTSAGIDLSEISFGANTTLAYSANSDNTGGTLTVSDGAHAQSLALLGQYTAASFVMAGDGHGGTVITDPALTQQSHLTLPHA